MTSNGPIPPISQLQDHDFHGTVEKVRKSRAQPRPTMWLSRSLGSVCINMCVFHAYLQLPTRLLLHKRFCLVSGWYSRVQQTNLLFRTMTKTALPDLAGMVWYYTMFNDMFYILPFILLAAIQYNIYR